jgi:hypothetical protein
MTDHAQADEHRKLLHIYLNDHRAAAAGGVRLAQRIARQHAGTPFGGPIARVATETEDDARVLDRVCERMGVTRNVVKLTLGAVGEHLSRLKFGGVRFGSSPPSHLLEVELLKAGVDARRSLWRALDIIDDPALRDFDFELLQRKATEHRERLDELHGSVARGLADATAATSATGINP